VGFAKACELGLEGIVSKREGSFYKSGRGRNWLKTKNADFGRT
jgi:bifunctional non-homologous end joining protein LigD